jgi:hypothetical protein
MSVDVIEKYPTDFRKRRINIGDTVVYPRRAGGKMWLCEGTVRDFQYHESGPEPWTLTVRVQTTDGARVGAGIPAGRCVVA